MGLVEVWLHVFLNLELDAGEWPASRHRYPLDRSLGGDHSQSGHGSEEKISFLSPAGNWATIRTKVRGLSWGCFEIVDQTVLKIVTSFMTGCIFVLKPPQMDFSVSKSRENLQSCSRIRKFNIANTIAHH
jgi:hypothetical protein